MDFTIATIRGDGIGPEIIEQAILVLEEIGRLYGHTFSFQDYPAGGAALDQGLPALPEKTTAACLRSDSVLLGAVGGPKWDYLSDQERPESALLGLRQALGLYANIRPAVLHEALRQACPLRPDLVEDGVDICVVRELTGGIYFGPRGRRTGICGEEAFDTEIYNVQEISRIAKTAFELAQTRKGHVTNIDKANVLESSRLWRSVILETAREYPEIRLDHMYVDNAAMQLIRDPAQFDVIVTTNMFGDILSDEASMLTGSIGMLPSASLGQGRLGLYEPIHGSAPDLAGKDAANPIATILSAALMLRYGFELEKEAGCIEDSVTEVLSQGYRTADIMTAGGRKIGCREMGELICTHLAASTTPR